MQESIANEEKWAKECLQELKEDGLEVREITTDPDSSAYRAAEQLYQSGYTHTEPTHYSARSMFLRIIENMYVSSVA